MARVPLPPVVALVFVLGTALLLVSNVPYGNLKKMKKGHGDRRKALFLFLVTLGLFVTLRGGATLALMATYVVGGFFKFDWGQWLSLPSEEGEELQA
jgi:phosphatidylserine synthase